jgi:predicted nicotinamide N-methyase
MDAFTGDLVEEEVAVGARTLRVLRPPDPEALLSEVAFEHEEFLPYWAELWPSGVALAREIAARDVAALAVLELGCGLGLPALAATAGGARVLAVDWSPDAVALLRRNAERNGVLLDADAVSWFEPDALAGRGPFDLVLAADVLYERRNAEPLLALLARVTAPDGEALLADPARPATPDFLARAKESWCIVSRRLWDSPRVELHALRRDAAHPAVPRH